MRKGEAAYERAQAIRDEGAKGFWLPKLWHAALRGHTDAMIELADWFSQRNDPRDLGTAADPWSPAGLYRRAFRLGNGLAAQHMAMSYFNRNDLSGYRKWLRRAALAGDDDELQELRRFETRLPHANAKPTRRKRPLRRSELRAFKIEGPGPR